MEPVKSWMDVIKYTSYFPVSCPYFSLCLEFYTLLLYFDILWVWTQQTSSTQPQRSIKTRSILPQTEKKETKQNKKDVLDLYSLFFYQVLLFLFYSNDTKNEWIYQSHGEWIGWLAKEEDGRCCPSNIQCSSCSLFHAHSLYIHSSCIFHSAEKLRKKKFQNNKVRARGKEEIKRKKN